MKTTTTNESAAHDAATDACLLTDLIARMRAVGVDLDYERWSRTALMIEAFADALDRELDLQTREDPSEVAEINVREPEPWDGAS